MHGRDEQTLLWTLAAAGHLRSVERMASIIFIVSTLTRGFYGPGFGLTGTDVYFPISTGLAVIGAFELKELEIDIGENGVAGLNGAQVAYSERQVYARDYNFTYSLQPNEAPRKASKLIRDQRFRRPKKEA
jgi:hypothetical protein